MFQQGFCKNFPPNVQSLRNKKFNLKILLRINLFTIDVLGSKENSFYEDEVRCYNLPNLSLVSKHYRKSRKNGGSGMYMQPNILTKPIINFECFNLNKHFKVVLLKLCILK